MLKIGDFSRLAQVSIKTLRYYDNTGLLKPAYVDRFTGYRYYAPDQLHRLNRILVLKDLGLSLEQIAPLLDSEVKPDELRGMLRLKQAELRQHIADAQARLGRLEMRLRQIEMEDKMPDYEVVTKRIDAQMVLSVRRIIPAITGLRGFVAQVKAAIQEQHIRPVGPWIILYHHAGFRDVDLDVEIAVPVDASTPEHIALSDGEALTRRMIPSIASAITALTRSTQAEINQVYHALSAYLQAHNQNYLGPAREVYLRGPLDTENPEDYLMEIQYPVGELTAETVVDGLELSATWKSENMPKIPFTRRARTALELAGIEAAALHQPEIRPVHLLPGLMRESEGFAAHVLADSGLTLEQARTLLSHGQHTASPQISEPARQVITLAANEAQTLGHHYIGTEHLLLALARQSDALVVNLLASGGVSVEQVRAAVMAVLNSPPTS